MHGFAFAAEANYIVSTQVELLRSTRMTTISDYDFSLPPSSPPKMANLEQRLLAFHSSMSATPQRHSPQQRPRANRDVHDIVSVQYQIALDSPYGSAFHTRDASYMRRQEFLFRSNMAEQLARFGRLWYPALSSSTTQHRSTSILHVLYLRSPGISSTLTRHSNTSNCNTFRTLNDPIAEDPYTYGTSAQPSSPRQLVYPRVSTETTLRALHEANSPPPAHCTRSKTDSHDSRRG